MAALLQSCVYLCVRLRERRFARASLTRNYSPWLSVQLWGWAVCFIDVKQPRDGQICVKTCSSPFLCVFYVHACACFCRQIQMANVLRVKTVKNTSDDPDMSHLFTLMHSESTKACWESKEAKVVFCQWFNGWTVFPSLVIFQVGKE